MILDCEKLDAALRAFSLRRDCDTLPDGTLRISTPFQHPDGSYIDVFLEQLVGLDKTSSLFKGYIVSDLGETASYLLSLGVKPWATKKRKQIVSDICESLGVEVDKCQFQAKLEVGELGDLSNAVVRVVQACIRAMDLCFTQRLPVSWPFRDEVEEFVDQLDVSYDTEPILDGRHGKEVVVDFRVHGPRVTSLIKTVSAGNPESAHILANEALARWFSLSNYRQSNQLITVLDGRPGIIRPEDVLRLKDVSDVIEFPSEQERLRAALAA